MRVLFFCDFAGSFGNATRISKIYQYLAGLKNHLIPFNLYQFHDSRLKLLSNPGFIASTVKNLQRLDLAYLKSEAFISLGISALKAAVRKHRPDLIFAEETRTAYMALKNGRNVPVIADLHGLISAEYAEDPNTKISNGHLARLQEIEDEVCKNAQDILVVSEPMKEYLAHEYGAAGHKITVLQNGTDLYPKTASYSSKMKCVFGGIFNHWEDVDTYLDMAMRDPVNEYVLIGKGPLKKHLLQRIDREKINVKYLGSMDRRSSLDLFCTMSIGIAPSTRNITRRVASPVKVYDYMSCGLPIITADCGQWARQVKENGCGFVAEESTAVEFLEYAARLQDRGVWEETSAACKRAVKTKFNWNQVLAPLNSVMGKH